MKENTWLYNGNEETWMVYKSYETKEEAIQAGKEEYEGNRHQFFVGQLRNLNIVPGVDADFIHDYKPKFSRLKILSVLRWVNKQ